MGLDIIQKAGERLQMNGNPDVITETIGQCIPALLILGQGNQPGGDVHAIKQPHCKLRILAT